MKKIALVALFLLCLGNLRADDGHQLWLRYDPVQEKTLLDTYLGQIKNFYVHAPGQTAQLIEQELAMGLSEMLQTEIASVDDTNASIMVVPSGHASVASFGITTDETRGLGEEGYLIRSSAKGQIIITANTSIGLYYGVFDLLRKMQMRQSVQDLDIVSVPKVETRMLNHWDNLDRTSERGYAGFAIWDWHRLPEYLDPIYAEYARANASLGINATVPINVNSNALILTPMYLEKVKALADVFRPYGIKMYLTARFSAPVQIGGLKTADPLDPEVAQWWKDKVDEIYEYIPDFGGFLVKANSEGQPGPHDYNRNHADGANMMAKALAPYGGKVIWRAFVYSEENPEDRHKQANDQFVPLDGQFEDNVLIQVKNGAIDFQPREPFHPLFGAMEKTNLAMEFQITQEYLGQATQLVFMGPYYKECLDSDTGIKNKNSLVSDVIDGSAYQQKHTLMAGVANIGTDRNWTGHLFGQSNWYAFGRLAWNPDISAQQIADEWVKMTFGSDKDVEETVKSIMMESREAAVNYMTPMGLHHLMATGHHYGPGPWVSNLGRPEWNPVYYHRADKEGIGFDRTSSGSNAIGQYNKSVAKKFESLKTCPEEYLLWFHHVSWNYQMQSGNILWDELALRYQQGVDQVRDFKSQWSTLEGKIDAERFAHVSMLLNIQEKEAIWWKDSSLLYFQTFSEKAFPEGVETPKGSLDYYKKIRFPYAPGIRPQW